MLSLPIDAFLPQIREGLREGGALVLEAEPGAGKTTRVPPALLDVVDGEILVLEPRRLAARMAARRVADERGERAGGTVGYRVRFEEAVSAKTRLTFVTEGVFLRRVLEDPKLGGVDAVVLDEFHERHLQSDLALALAKRVREARAGLRIVVMSATLEAAPIAQYLGAATTLSVPGRRFEVALEHQSAREVTDRPLEQEVAAAVRRLIADGLDGDVLVFLPGAAEIRRAAAACAELARRHDLDVLPLHGDLSPEEQDRAVEPGPRKKVILSTNVAETSLTIEGVVAVVDSGLARVASHSPWSGLPTLRVQRVSRASATQRAGRAGRTRAGRCLRLYTKHDYDTRPAFELPEIRRLDLAEPLLQLAATGVPDPARFDWFEPPGQAALEAARELLQRLGAVDAGFSPTEIGRRMLAFPLHPRQARLVVEAERRGVAREACVVAALLGEGELARERGAAKVSGPADVLADLDRFDEATRVRLQPDRLRGLGLDVGATLATERVRKQLERVARTGTPRPRTGEEVDQSLGLAILAGYPDRVARRRKAGGAELVLSSGGTAQLAQSSVVRDAELMVALDAEERGEQGRAGVVSVRSASRVEPEWLLDLAADRLVERVEPVWNAEAGRVDVVRRLVYDQLTIEERRAPARADDGEVASAVLLEAARARGARALVDGEALERLLGRLAFLRSAAPELAIPPVGDAEVDAALAALCIGKTRLDELDGAELLHALLAPLPPEVRRKLDDWAPERVTLPGGRAVRVQYPTGQPPFIESRLQDFFGMLDGPRVARGRVALTLHLLAPNQRAVQVTSDLAGFWERHYPSIRRELCRRYPRHAWPDDPKTAQPPSPRPRRS
jgi:ATP-dependent helicase HrpB